MGDFDFDGSRIVQIIIILFVFFAGFVRMLFGALKSGRKGPEGGGKFMPPKDLQEFLREIRGQQAEAEKRPPPVLEPGEPRLDRAQGNRETVTERLQPGRREVPDRKTLAPVEKEVPERAEPRETVHEYLEHLREEGRVETAREALAPADNAHFAAAPPRPLSRADEEFAARFGRLDEPGAGTRGHLRRGLHEIQHGLTLRDAVVAQTILGPPRSRDPHHARLGPRGRPLQGGAPPEGSGEEAPPVRG